MERTQAITEEDDNYEDVALPRPLHGENPDFKLSKESFVTLDWPKALFELSSLAFHYSRYQLARLQFIDTIDETDFLKTPLSTD